MKKHGWKWLLGVFLIAILSVLPMEVKAADNDLEVEYWEPFGNDDFTMEFEWEEDYDYQLLGSNGLGEKFYVYCGISNFYKEDVQVKVTSSNPDVVEIYSSSQNFTCCWGGTTENVVYTIKGFGIASIIFEVDGNTYEKVICVLPKKVDITGIKQDGDMITLTWDKVGGMSGYIIESHPVGNYPFEEIATVEKNTNTASVQAVWNEKYQYRVVPYVQNGNQKILGGTEGKTRGIQLTINFSTIKTVKPYKDDYLKITWTKSKDAVGYKLYRSEKKTSGYKCVYTAKSNKTTSWKQKVTRGKKYYYCIVTICKHSQNEPSQGMSQTLPKMKLDRTKTNLLVGKKTELELKGTSKKVTWSSSNKKVATVNKKGIVTGKKTGTATITAKVGKKKFKCKVTVKNAYLNAEKVTIYKGEDTLLSIKGSKIKSIKSSNKKVITVKKTGWITAKKAGKATVTVKGKNGKTYKCKVTVKNPKTIKNKKESIEWQQDSVYLEYFDTYIPRLKKFNTPAIASLDNWWGGPEDNLPVVTNPGLLEIHNTFEDVKNALGEQGGSKESSSCFTSYYNSITWSWNSASNPYFGIKKHPSTGVYTLAIKQSLKDAPYGKWNLADWNKDVVKALLSFISSEPEEVFDAIYECLYEDMYVLSTTEYTKVGDCQVRMDPAYSFKDDGSCNVIFYIRPQ